MGGTRVDDDEFERRLRKDVEDNWPGILVTQMFVSAEALHGELRRMTEVQLEMSACLTDAEPLLQRIRRDAADLQEILIEHGLIPVLSRRRARQ